MNRVLHLKKAYAYIDALSLRERAIILITGLALLLMAWDSFLLQKQLKSKSGVGQKVTSLKVEIQSANAQKIMLQAKLTQDPNLIERKKLQRSQEEIERIDGVLKEKTLEFISPRQMVEVLRNLVEAESGLQLTSLESLTPKVPLADESGGEIEQQLVASIETPTVYLHGLEMNFRGDFMSVLSYIRRLESLKWRFAWDSFEIKLDKYPVTNATIRLETLSLTEGWIGV